MSSQNQILILGDGFLSQTLEKIVPNGLDLKVTSRSKPNRIRFDLHKKDTWNAIDKTYSATIWTFPATPIEDVKDFYKEYGAKMGTLLVISSTGFFQFDDGDEVNERNAIDLSGERAQAEEYLREQGASVLHAAGIYGPGRNPLDWVRSGRVGPSNKLVNWIHVEDLAQICWAALSRFQPGQRWIAADSQPQSWLSMIERWKKDYGVQSRGEGRPGPSKRVNAQETLQRLQVSLKFRNIYEGVSHLEKDPRAS